MSHDPYSDLVAPYALGALEHDEAEALEAHLETCEECRQELADFRGVSVALAEAVPPRRASQELRDRVMSTVRAEAELLAAAGPAADRPPRRRWWRLGNFELRPSVALAGVLAVAVAGTFGFALGGNGGPDETRTVRAQVTSAAGARASALLEERGERKVLRVRDFAGPGRGRVYQVWTQPQKGTQPEPTSVLFTLGKDRAAAVELPAEARRARRVLVSSEPAGGSPTGIPSRAPVLVAED